MTFHDTILCDEYTQDGSLDFVDEGVADATAALGGACGGCRAGVGGVAAGRGRSKYVPASLVTAVRARLVRGEQVAEVLTEISAINAELLARRELI